MFNINPLVNGIQITCNSNEYCVDGIKLESRNGLELVRERTAGNVLNVTGLASCQPFKIRVTSGSNSIAACATPLPPTPRTPSSIRIVNLRTPGYQMLEWKDDSSKHAMCAVNYVVIYQQINGESRKLKFQPHELPAVMGDLVEDTLYNYTIHTDLGWGLATSLASEPVSLRTPKCEFSVVFSPVTVYNYPHSEY
ncbi:hypothetical protein PHET_09280 [Paragonimus heterotremus]|uniref:Fibronectin type-III domain-containing protein n=1 Tax=Paragonimus heterotremus TaxID=100268 RepID=A0A8J4SL26_9TREM|nr:hypothetical protein PHET_09280 [Paragonimus heterotremus]